MRQALAFTAALCMLFDSGVKGLSISDASQRPTALVTGSTDGIGLTTAKNLAAKGYNVLLHGKDSGRIEKACAVIHAFVEEHSNDPSVLVLPIKADIQTVNGCEGLVSQVQRVCQEKDLKLSVLMNNAGVYVEELTLTSDGTEQTFAVNVLAPFIISSMLLPSLLQQRSRIVIASSVSQCRRINDWEDIHYSRRPYSAHGAYAESKLMDAMLTFEIADRLISAGITTERITCNCLDPGTVNTKMLLAGWGPIGIAVEDALDETWLCSDDGVKDITGKYFTWRSPRNPSGSAYDQIERDKLWKILLDLAPDAAKIWNFPQIIESIPTMR